MNSRAWGSLLFCLGLAACSGWSSELDTAYIADNKKSEKPICDFKPKNNCYAQNIRLLMSCVQPVGMSPEKLSHDKDWTKCDNETGKEILFLESSLKSYVFYDGSDLKFSVWDGQKKCFEFSGNQDNYEIHSEEFGKISVNTLENGDVRVSCFYDEGFVIPSQALKMGCRGEKTLAKDLLPTNKLTTQKVKTQSENEVVYDHFQFSLMGAGVPSQPIFKCEL